MTPDETSIVPRVNNRAIRIEAAVNALALFGSGVCRYDAPKRKQKKPITLRARFPQRLNRTGLRYG
jgi:hypothetical protein